MNNQAGKGDAERVRDFNSYRENYDRIFKKNNPIEEVCKVCRGCGGEWHHVTKQWEKCYACFVEVPILETTNTTNTNEKQ